MREFYQDCFTGKRALFLKIRDSIFDDGASPLKHSSNIDLAG